MAKPAHDLRRGSTIVVYVEGEEGVRGYFGTALAHTGQGVVNKAKIPSGENYAQTSDGGWLVQTGVNYVGPIPHGDETQGGTWVWPDEVPAGFYVG